MLVTWLVLLAASVLFGVAIVGAMVLPGLLALTALALAASGLGVALWMASDLLGAYGTLEAVLASAFFMLAGSGIGYRVAASAIPLLGDVTALGRLDPPASGGSAVILVASTDPERYDMRAVARRHVRLTEGAHLEIPPTAVPFVFLTAKARYRAAGGRSPGAGLAGSLANRVRHNLASAGHSAAVDLVLDGDAAALGSLIARHANSGSRAVSVVVLGAEDTGAIDRARAPDACVSVAFGPAIWHDTALAARLVERILGAADGVRREDLGVVLVSEGAPPQWEYSNIETKRQENYFNQRVRLLLTESGLDERAVRIAWLDWQLPDVTEAVRHVAALGRTTIVVAPSTIALPSLESTTELTRAIDLARLPESVRVIKLAFWGDDEGFATAVALSAAAALPAASATS